MSLLQLIISVSTIDDMMTISSCGVFRLFYVCFAWFVLFDFIFVYSSTTTIRETLRANMIYSIQLSRFFLSFISIFILLIEDSIFFIIKSLLIRFALLLSIFLIITFLPDYLIQRERLIIKVDSNVNIFYIFNIVHIIYKLG